MEWRTAGETHVALYDAMALSSPRPAYVRACRRTPTYHYSHLELAGMFVIRPEIGRRPAMKKGSTHTKKVRHVTALLLTKSQN